MNKELEILTFADVCVKGFLQDNKELLEEWRKDREVLYSALEQKEKLEKVVEIFKPLICTLNFNIHGERHYSVGLRRSVFVKQEVYDLFNEVLKK